jgi:hypothetical protein
MTSSTTLSCEIIRDKTHKACIQASDQTLYKIFGVRNQTDTDRLEHLNKYGYEAKEGFYLKVKQVLDNKKYGKVIYIFKSYV